MSTKRQTKMKRPRASEVLADDNVIQGPAKFHACHSQRALDHRAGAKKGWRNDAEHPLTLAYVKGQLIRGIDAHTAAQRFEAGDRYRAACEASRHKTRDSTDTNLVSGGKGESVTGHMIDAFRWLQTVDAKLNRDDIKIIRLVCGEGYFPSEAVRATFGHDHYKFAVIPRFNEALDHLVEAIDAIRRK